MWGLRTLYAMGMQIVPGMRVCKRHKDMGRKVTHGRAGQVCMVVCGSKADIRGQGDRTLGPWGGLGEGRGANQFHTNGCSFALSS